MKLLTAFLTLGLWSGTALAQTLPPQALETPNTNSRSLTDLFNQEVELLREATRAQFRIQVLKTNDPAVRKFIAQGILKMNPDIYTQMESGLAGMYVYNGQIDGKKGPVCYVLNNPDRSEHLWKGFVLNQSTSPTPEHIQWVARYMLSHEVGHCLDQSERLQKIMHQSWTRDQAESLGIALAAFDRTFGDNGKIDFNGYQSQMVVLFRDGAQLQYQERVADAFAVFWLKQHQAPSFIFDTILQQRQQVTNRAAYHAHATVPTVQYALDLSQTLTAQQPLSVLWQNARLAQQKGGVDRTLWQGSQWVHADAEKREAAPGQKPGVIAPNGVKPAVIRFGQTKKFGQN